ncbi:TRAP transporter large permease subunit [Pusillimonas sp. TS35]|uniref:TRAP transporter large permease n=1 Tax=Paracandidimonas lactea TaxID=2895524 RepID=UPI0013683E92|nr:TRAP transporter large permease [Paracandidimonas lactea]MYN14810.1 TRAP transporter large permease subunit [Pusillimonas sp. TS35]
MSAALILTFFTALSLAVPVAFALGLATIAAFLLIDPDFLPLLPQRIFTGLDMFALVAIPFFILAGELMGGSGIMDRILNFSRMLVGHVRGSVGQVTVLVSMIFGWINGSGVAGASAVGSMLIPKMEAEYKNKGFACAVTACSATVGPIIPPSVPMIIYALVAQNVSVGAMFAAGVVPGVLIGGGLMGIVYLIARKRGYPAEKGSYSLLQRLAITRQFAVGAFLPVIMVGGIMFGVFTPVEAGAVAVLYALLIGLFVTRTLTAPMIWSALRRTGVISSVVFLMMGVANVASWIMTTEQLPQAAAEALSAITTNPLVFLLLVNIILLIAGLFLDTVAAMVMFGPLLIPMAAEFGIDPLQFGLIFTVNLIIGLVTPPVGLCLFIAAGIGKTPIEAVVKESLPFLAWLLVVLGIVTYVPSTYMWLPKMLGY